MNFKTQSAIAILLLLNLDSIHAENTTVRLGHVGSISGSSAHVGKDNENGVRMAIDDVNAKGLTFGGKKSGSSWLPKTMPGIPSKPPPPPRSSSTVA